MTPELARRDGIVEIPMYAGSNYAFSEQQSHTEHGVAYGVSITGTIPAHLVSAETVRRLCHGKWMVLHRDTMGRIRLSGTALVPIQFSTTSATGQSAEEMNGEQFAFTATEPEPSPECYIPDMAHL